MGLFVTAPTVDCASAEPSEKLVFILAPSAVHAEASVSVVEPSPAYVNCPAPENALTTADTTYLPPAALEMFSAACATFFAYSHAVSCVPPVVGVQTATVFRLNDFSA